MDNFILNDEIKAKLINGALQARELSYCPYSHYAVGACLVSSKGNIYKGCNVENASYGASNCAERTAVFKAVSEGERSIIAIAIAGGPYGNEPDDYAYPCGICRQVLREFSDPEKLKIYVVKSPDDYKEYTLSSLLPESFGPDHLNIRN